MSTMLSEDAVLFTKEAEGLEEGREFCAVCYVAQRRGSFSELSACGHRACVGCTAMHVRLGANERRGPISCLHTDCSCTMSTAEVGQFLSPAQLTVYSDRLVVQTENNARLCPRCHKLGHYNLLAGPAVVCESCNLQFCFNHETAHGPTMDCASYERQVLLTDNKSIALIRTIAKVRVFPHVTDRTIPVPSPSLLPCPPYLQPCPSCQFPVELVGGCAHVVYVRSESSSHTVVGVQCGTPCGEPLHIHALLSFMIVLPGTCMVGRILTRRLFQMLELPRGLLLDVWDHGAHWPCHSNLLQVCRRR